MSSPLYLLDTHALLWWMADDPRLSTRVRSLIEDSKNGVLVSVASLWEIAIKTRRGHLRGCEEYLSRFGSLHERWGFGTLTIGPTHAVTAGLLEWEHRDPFDRMLVAQSLEKSAPLVTCDSIISRFHPNCFWD
jgi:PIN domain nuclease of toxin-antitoxin system